MRCESDVEKELQGLCLTAMKMSSREFTVGVQRALGCLIVIGIGPAGLADHRELVDVIARAAAVRGNKRVLIDLTCTEPHLMDSDHLQLGAYVAQVLSGFDRVATVVAPGYRTGANVKSAQRKGLNIRTFTSMNEATSWLAKW